jgi:eukaryotic-like serine/threonine-protein kinase
MKTNVASTTRTVTTRHYRVCYDDVTMSDVGKRLGRYVLEQPLGRGGMAEAWLARAEGPAGFEKRVVLKRILPTHADDAAFIEMFMREARLAARLNHPNVVQVFELAEVDGAWIIAMEHLDGLTLRRAAKKSWSMGDDFPMEVVLRSAIDAARGLAEAHALGLVHRDVSPDNLMLTRAGVTKVLDFGIAKLTSTEPGDHVTRTGEIKGKLPFMSPEQVRGEAIDGRTDLWSLGVTMYWLLTGRRPFVGDNDAQILNAILNEVPPTLRSLNALVPSRVEKIVLALLEKNRDKRMASGSALAGALVEILGPVAAGPEPALLVEKLLAAPEPPPASPGAPERTQVASRPQTSWLMRSEQAGDTMRLVDAGGSANIHEEETARSTIVTDVAPPRRGIYVGVASALFLAALGVLALTIGPDTSSSPSRPSPPSPPSPHAIVDAGALVATPAIVTQPVDVVAPVDGAPVDAKLVKPRPVKRSVDAGTPARVDDAPVVVTPVTPVTPVAQTDESVLESCTKPCASLWRSARDGNKGTPESRKKMATSCASICRSN